jgi:pyruvate ferredoxin oxidoreductase beta subunit
MNFKELAVKPQKLVPGHRSCAGCGFPQIVRTILSSTDKPIVVANATGCLEVTTTIYPYSSWNIPWIHNAFENAASTISGTERAYAALKKKGKIKQDIKFVAFGGDGGTYDIGFQALSGMVERGHDVLYVLYDNEAYMNTGVQRSSATPFGAATTTAPEGKVIHGKEEFRKDISKIMVAHDIPYVAQASMHNVADLSMKAAKAFEIKGPKFIVCLQPCMLGWSFPMHLTVEMSKLAVETRFWPLYEVENGVYKLNYKPKKYVPITEWMKHQRRFKHLLKPENKSIVKKIQEHVDMKWNVFLWFIV